MTKLEVVTRSLRDASVPFALIGAVALAARGASRSTLDIDLLTTDRTSRSIWRWPMPATWAAIADLHTW